MAGPVRVAADRMALDDLTLRGLSADLALDGIQDLPLPNQARLARMRGQIPEIQIGDVLELGPEWQAVRDRIVRFKDSGQ